MMINYKHDAERFLELINCSKTIFISSHVSVDGDNLGSLTAMYQMLKNMGKNVYALKSDVIPYSYSFIPAIDEVVELNNKDLVCDLYITVDSADIDRLGTNKELYLKAKNKIVIDHHSSNIGYGDLNIIYPEISSTCEIVTELLLELGITITPNIATSLFTGISTDTGRFLYSNVSARTFELAKTLLEMGAKMDKINLHLYQSRPVKKVRVLKAGLDKMKIELEGKLSYSIIRLEDLEKIDAEIYDLDEIIDFIRDTEGVIVSFLIKEIELNSFKVSLRSKGDFDVAKIAQEFGGGGHINAAGMSFSGELNELKDTLIERVKNGFKS